MGPGVSPEGTEGVCGDVARTTCSFMTAPLGQALDDVNHNFDLDGDERFVPMLPRVLRQLLVQDGGLRLVEMCCR